jgi:hypothetical protein
MDPNAALAEIRAILTNPSFGMAEAFRLAELVDGLDDWLTHGGFMPTEWAPGEKESK